MKRQIGWIAIRVDLLKFKKIKKKLKRKESCQDKLGHDFFYCISHSVFPRFSLNNNKSQKLN